MKIKLLTKENCTYCTLAKRLLDRKGLSFEEWSQSDPKRESEVAALRLQFGNATFPMIFIDDSYIGGAQELQQWLFSREGE